MKKLLSLSLSLLLLLGIFCACNKKETEKDDGVKVPYTLIMERVENVIFIGSEAAIKIAK